MIFLNLIGEKRKSNCKLNHDFPRNPGSDMKKNWDGNMHLFSGVLNGISFQCVASNM